MTQLMLFNMNDDNRPAPERIADGGQGWHQFPLQFHDVEGVRYYAVQDFVRGVTGKPDVRAILSKLKKRDPELLNSVQQLPYTATDRKIYQVDFTTQRGLYEIVQRIDIDTAVRKRILSYLAAAGEAMDDMRRDPSKAAAFAIAGYKRQGKSAQWIGTRLDGKLARRALTDALSAKVIDANQQNYAVATNDIYKGLFERTAKALREALGIKPSQSIRDALCDLGLGYLRIVEMTIARKLDNVDSLTWEEAEQIINDVIALIQPQVSATQASLGIDLATGRNLLRGAQ